MASDRPILLVEDNPDDEALTLRAFNKNRIANPVVVARDGVEALDYLFASGPHRDRNPNLLPAVILLDLKLPRIDGLEVLRRIRANEATSLLPVVILSNLTADQAAQVLTEFSEELRNNVSYRMATLGKVSPALLAEVEDVVEDIARTEISQSMSSMGGSKSMASVLNKCNGATAKVILEHIEQSDPQLASEIKRLMFMFEDLLYVDDRGIQRVLREVDKRDLAMSLKVVDDKLKDKVLRNMSERARELLQEELQYMGPVRLKEVEGAQTRIVEIVKQLEDQGEIVVAGRGGSEEVFV